MLEFCAVFDCVNYQGLLEKTTWAGEEGKALEVIGSYPN